MFGTPLLFSPLPFPQAAKSFSIPDAAKEEYLKKAINKGTDKDGATRYEYGDNVTVAINKDGSGKVSYPSDQKTKKALEINFGPKPEQNYKVDKVWHTDEGRSLTYSSEQNPGINGQFTHISIDGKSGYSRTPTDSTKPAGDYTEKHWGEKEEDKYTIAVTKNKDGSKTKTYENGSVVQEDKDGIEISGYDLITHNGVPAERHWGREDKDFYFKTVNADGTEKKELIPRNYDAMIDKHGVSQTDGVYIPDKKELLLTETYLAGTMRVMSFRPEAVLAHELGHAWDYSLSQSNSKIYKTASSK